MCSDSQFHGQAFELLPDAEDLLGVLQRRLGDEAPLVWNSRNQAGPLQLEQRFPDSRVSDAQLPGAGRNSTIRSPGLRSPDVMACLITSTIRCLRVTGLSGAAVDVHHTRLDAERSKV